MCDFEDCGVTVQVYRIWNMLQCACVCVCARMHAWAHVCKQWLQKQAEARQVAQLADSDLSEEERNPQFLRDKGKWVYTHARAHAHIWAFKNLLAYEQVTVRLKRFPSNNNINTKNKHTKACIRLASFLILEKLKKLCIYGCCFWSVLL